MNIAGLPAPPTEAAPQQFPKISGDAFKQQMDVDPSQAWRISEPS